MMRHLNRPVNCRKKGGPTRSEMLLLGLTDPVIRVDRDEAYRAGGSNIDLDEVTVFVAVVKRIGLCRDFPKRWYLANLRGQLQTACGRWRSAA